MTTHRARCEIRCKTAMSLEIYDNFDGVGYSLADYDKKWMLTVGPGEMAVKDTRDFSGGHLSLSAVHFRPAPTSVSTITQVPRRVDADLSGAARRDACALLGDQGVDPGYGLRADPARCLRPRRVLA